MERGISRRVAIAGLGSLSLLALTTIVGGAPVLGSGQYGPLLMGASETIWTGEKPQNVAASVATASGKTRVQGFLGGNGSPNFGPAPAGFTMIIEGNYDTVKVTGMDPAPTGSSGSYTVRGPTGPADNGPDRTIGSGSASLPTGPLPSTYTFYWVQTPSPRVASVRAGPYPVSVTDGAAPLVAVDAGDATFCSKGSASKFGLSGTGTVQYTVSDLTATMTPITGSCVCQPAGDTDMAFCDGTVGLSVTLSAGATNGGNVTVACAGGTPASADLAPGSSQTFTGNLTSLQWTYSAAGSTINWSVRGN